MTNYSKLTHHNLIEKTRSLIKDWGIALVNNDKDAAGETYHDLQSALTEIDSRLALLPDANIHEKRDPTQSPTQRKGSNDPLYTSIKSYILTQTRISTSQLQRQFSIGYNHAAKLMEKLEEEKVIGPSCGSKAREVYKPGTFSNSSTATFSNSSTSMSSSSSAATSEQ